MARLHDKRRFFKYLSAETALKIITSKSLRWSSPLKFNDPFDHQIGFSFGFTGEQLGAALLEEMKRIVFDGKVTFKQPTLFSQLAMRLGRIRERLPRDEFLRDMSSATIEIANNLDNHIDKLHDAIQEHLAHSRVLCVSELHDNVVMWSHYSEQHEGVVLELRCVDEIDNMLLAACPVRYARNFPSFPSLDDYVRHLTGEEPMDFAELSWEIAFTKHEDWSYEKEWRVHLPLIKEPAGEGYSVYKEAQRVFGDVYLGCRIEDRQAARISEAVRRHLPHVRLFRGKTSKRSFDLEFEQF